MKTELALNGKNLSLRDFYQVVHEHRPLVLSQSARGKMTRARSVVTEIVSEERVVYGVNTGFGKLAREHISSAEISSLQLNLIRSHACGSGPLLDKTVVRGMLLLRAQVLSMGHSGVRPLIVERLIAFLNMDLRPCIPSRGSVGACGDLIPLAHLALLLIGEGRAIFEGQEMEGAEALKKARLSPIVLEAKEGLSLVNGTQAALSVGLLALDRAKHLAATADLAGAMSLEALMGTPTAFDARIQALRPHPGQVQVAARLRDLLKGSGIRDSHIGCDRVQDPYSIRCIPQVHGAVHEAIEVASRTLEIEMNSVTDNPLVFPDAQEILSGGNFHGHPVALALDVLAIVLTHLGIISERRIAQLIDPEDIDLPPFLTRRPGLHSGLMMPQVAAAALASECKLLSHPASVDSIPTSVNQEDYVSMAMGAALKLSQIVENVSSILAIELFAAAEGISFHAPLKPGKGLQRAIKQLRAQVAPLDEDRSLSGDFETISRMILKGEFV